MSPSETAPASRWSNKLAPFRQAEFDILYGKGVNLNGELVDIGADMGLVRKAGSWYSLGEDRIGQGRDNACQFLAENSDKGDALRLHPRASRHRRSHGEQRRAREASHSTDWEHFASAPSRRRRVLVSLAPEERSCRIAVETGASDLHLKGGARPMIRVDGSMAPREHQFCRRAAG